MENTIALHIPPLLWDCEEESPLNRRDEWRRSICELQCWLDGHGGQRKKYTSKLCQTIWNWSEEEEVEEEVVVMMVMRRDHQRPLSTAMKLMI